VIKIPRLKNSQRPRLWFVVAPKPLVVRI